MEQTYGNPENIFPHKNVCYNHFQIDFSSPKTHQMTFHRDYDGDGNDSDDLNDYDYGFQWTHFIFA